MSRLDELIAELCPDGVEYKALGEIGTFIRGNGLQKKDFTESGVGCIHYGQIYTFYRSFAYKTKSFVSEELAKTLKMVTRGDLIFAITSENIEDVCKCLAWLGDNDIVIGGHSAIFKHNQNSKYITYYTQTEDFFRQKRKIVTGTKVIEAAPSKLALIKVPVPPIPVQEEIVRILDNFAELTAELTAELSKRKQQYQYYRDMLLTFDGIRATSQTAINSIAWRQIIDICEISRGKVISKDYIRYNIGNYPVYSSQTENDGELGRISTYIHDGEYITWTTDGANAGSVFYRFGKFSITNVCGLLKIKDNNILTKYVYYSLGRVAKEYVNSGMGNPKLMSNMIAKIKIPVPPLEEQKRIVAILDRFDALCNDLTSGLPAEIEARKKQYEYYRDKLLTFKEAV